MQAQPNVVVIFIDQLRACTVGCYGDPVVRTPHMDRLAAGGVRFEQGISNNPVCVPARSILMTGQYSRTCTGALGNVAWAETDRSRRRLRDTTVAEGFKELGYATAIIGKWHMDPDPHVVGFDYSLVSGATGSNARFTENGGRPFARSGFNEDYLILKAREFIGQHRERPFFLYFNIIPPHMPVFDIPYQYNRMYHRDQVPLRANVWQNGEMARSDRWFHIYLWQHLYHDDAEPVTARLPDDFDLRDLTAFYYGATTWADAIVGEVVGALEANGLLEDTLIVVTADHGDNLGSHHHFNKDRHWEESVRVPMIFHHPERLRAGAVNAAHQAQLIDLFPTLMDYCGAAVPEAVQGTSFAPVLRGETETVGDNVAFIETPYHEIVLRTPRYKLAIQTPYTRIQDPIPPELPDPADLTAYFYDLETDPLEMHNLIGVDEYNEVVEAMKVRLLEWNRSTPWLRGEDGEVLKAEPPG